MLKSIHAIGRHVFLALDRVFNRVFGDTLNPLYYLGAISYSMFWIVVVSGFYIYAFYETGVDTTFASVERLTHAQWYAGGVMRSLHRYASDAMVLTMLLHLARHFFFDRYRGFRAFSWITGVVVLWLAYASGVNGYMLPWDRLAQYVVTTTAEWFDVLPVFRGTLVRNFTLPEAITDRLFSLLSFLHIGIPLAMLAALWIHTQRVPNARTQPPRRLVLGLLAMLLALALVKPVVSQGAADFSSTTASLSLDWFYLLVYPLVTSGQAMGLWMVVGGLTGLFVILPWLPPARSGATHPRQMTLHPGNRTVPVRPGETLLDAGLRAKLALPFECRSGGCGVCRATVLAGAVDPGDYQKSALSDEARARGEVLLCCACALSDLEVELEPGAALREHALPLYGATVTRLAPLAHDVMLVELALEPGRAITFEAGQYINILLADGARRSYSFTRPSGTTDRIELHIRLVPGGRFSTQVFQSMRVGDVLQFEGPLGSFILHEPSDKPLIFVAGATGFAPVKSLLEQAFHLGIQRPLYFYWGVRSRRDFYLAQLPPQWAAEHPNFHFVPVLSAPEPADDWDGRTGLVHEAILADFPSLAGCAVYACGSAKMVEVAKPAFIRYGLADEFCYSDAFTPQSTPSKGPAAV
jgi:NAD(P)H-flavin reductase/quinol-cytochrome oxidoreductase complex cytochrome b subunit